MMMRVIGCVLGVLLLMAWPLGAQAQDGQNFDAWSVRCEGQGWQRQCEAYQRLVTAQGQGVAELAISFADPAKMRGQDNNHIAPPPVAPSLDPLQNGRAVIVLPLGIVIPAGVTLLLDNAQRHAFEVRYCTPEGCFAYLTMTRAMIDRMGRALSAQISFRSLDGQHVELPLDVKGFTSALQAVR